MAIEKHPLIPDDVAVQIPQSLNEADEIRAGIKQRLDTWVENFGGWPEKYPSS